ncbi:MAG TPA: hypothetical protein PLS10_07125 [Chitinophagales bacterium]|nr:hypothetical protein [Chitinophagales bacterium]
MKTTFGGNSGYINYSESVRSLQAKNEGRFPKSLFKKEYEISEKKFKELEERGIIYISEWHHTSKFGNRTNFYAISDYVLFYLLTGKKDVAYNIYKKSKPNYKPLPFNKKSYNNKISFLAQATEHFIGVVEEGDVVKFKGAELKCISKTKHRKAPVFVFSK